jgi:hypothetical protein
LICKFFLYLRSSVGSFFMNLRELLSPLLFFYLQIMLRPGLYLRAWTSVRYLCLDASTGSHTGPTGLTP